MSSSLKLARARAAAADGRMASIRFQQEQLVALHKSLLDRRSDVMTAIRSASGATSNEAEIEFASTVVTVRQYYEAIDFEKSLADEYRLARGESSPLRRVGYGVVVVKPTQHTRLFSVLSVVGCAIAAGNTVVIECDDTNAVDQLLHFILQPLDWEIYALLQEPVTDPVFLKSALIVDQTGQVDASNCIRSRPDLRVVAAIDRSADVELAARHIIAAHTAYNGSSAHAPEIVAVNEWVRSDFIDACRRTLSELCQDKRRLETVEDGQRRLIDDARRTGQIDFIQLPGLSILEIKTRSCPVLKHRRGGKCLIMLTVTSLVDAVLALTIEPEYLVAYHFGDPAVGKFWSQQINSHATFVNHIPGHLLVGPALMPNQHTIPIEQRYTTDMLSRPRPEMIESPKKRTANLMDFHCMTQKGLDGLRKEAGKLPKPTGQGPGTAIGFFEQGILVGATFIVLPTLSVAGYMGWALVKHVVMLYS